MSSVQFKQQGNISVLSINDEKVNALSYDLLCDLRHNLDRCSKDRGALCIMGRPGFFSAGFDVNVFQSGEETAIKEMIHVGFQLLIDLLSFPRPIVMACTGHAVGMGVFLLCCADYRMGVNGAFKLHANEVVNGMHIPPLLMKIAQNRLLPNHVFPFLLNAEPYAIQKGISLGLIDDLVSEKDLSEKCFKRAQLLSLCQDPGYRQSKQSALSGLIKDCKQFLSNV